nr:ABC transporter permease [Candidatus Sigynarchaeota archaeon]
MSILSHNSTKNIKVFFRNNWNDFVYAFKDLKTQKAKTFFAIGGIMLSIFVMQVVGVLTDSLAYSYLDSSATSAGAADFMITKNLQLNIGFNPYMNQTIVQSQLDTISEIESVYPRLLLMPIADVINPGPADKPDRTITFYGLDVQGEHQGGLGRFKYVGNSSYFDRSIPDGFCIISPFIRDTLHVNVSDQVTIHYATFNVVNLTVMAIVEQQQKFSLVEVDTVVTNLHWVQTTFMLQGKVNYFVALLRNREMIYDSRNVAGTIDRMRHIAEGIQLVLGYDFSVQMLKLTELENSEMMNVAMSVAFVFISVISSLISAILINSILSTAVEERIREFGIFRVVGSRRSFPFKLVIYQGFFLSLFGSIIGIVAGSLFAQVALPILYDWLHLWTNPIQLVVQPTTILTSLALGIGITLVVTAFPAYKAASTKIVQAINPYRHQETGWKVKKEGRINTQLIAGGLSAVVAGSLVFYLIPQLVLTGEVSVILVAFIGVQLAFLLGLTLVSLGFIPGLERLILSVFRIFNKRTTPIIRTSLYRYRRRNTSTVLMFSMTFAFILFIGTTLELMKVAQRYQITVNYGSPMVVYSSSRSNQVDENLMNKISLMPNVKSVSGAYTDAIDVAALMLQLSQQGVGDLNFSSFFESDRYYVQIGDLINYYTYTGAMMGIDENYTEMMPPELMEVTGGIATVERLNQEPTEPNVIISKSVASAAQLGINDNMRLTFYSNIDNSLKRIVNATIIGISDGLPGFWEFREAKLTSFYAGVMCSKENYLNWMDMNHTNAPLSKIFIDVDDRSTTALDALRNEIDRTYQDTPKSNGELYSFIVEHAQSRVDMMMQSLSTVQLLFQTILSFAVMVALFGLMSSVYSTVLERKREIGVLKALGLKNKQTRNLFIIESVIILLSSSIAGALIGILSSYINTYQQTALTEVPLAAITNITNLPWPTMLGSFGFALVVCLAGMFILLRRIEKMEIMEIFRSTM